MILAHALLKIDIREKLPRPLVGSPHRSPRRMPSSRESCPPPKRHRVLQQPASSGFRFGLLQRLDDLGKKRDSAGDARPRRYSLGAAVARIGPDPNVEQIVAVELG